jgi:hypothetical protein
MSDREILKSMLAATPECLTPQQLEGLLDGKNTHPHLAQCPRCQGELTLLKSFESSAPLPDEGAAVGWISSHLNRQLESIKNPSAARLRGAGPAGEDRPSLVSRIFGLRGWLLALPATAIVAVIVGIVLMRTPTEPDLQASAGRNSMIYRSQELQVVGPVGDLQRVPQKIQWQRFPGADAYKVVVMEVDNSQLWSGQTKDTSLEIPAPLRGKMLPGKPMLWQVTALDGKGQVLGTSQIQRFAAPRKQSSGTFQHPSRER